MGFASKYTSVGWLITCSLVASNPFIPITSDPLVVEAEISRNPFFCQLVPENRWGDRTTPFDQIESITPPLAIQKYGPFGYKLTDDGGKQLALATKKKSPHRWLYHSLASFTITDRRGRVIGAWEGNFSRGQEQPTFLLTDSRRSVQCTLTFTEGPPYIFLHSNRSLGEIASSKKGWTISLFSPDQIEPRIIWLFAGFFIDHYASLEKGN